MEEKKSSTSPTTTASSTGELQQERHFAFLHGEAELVLVPEQQSADAPDDNGDETNHRLWLSVSLHNFTGQLLIRSTKPAPPKSAQDTSSPTSLTPVRRNTQTYVVDQVSSSPPRLTTPETSAMGFAVLDNASLSSTANETPTKAAASSSLFLPVIAEAASSDHEIDYDSEDDVDDGVGLWNRRRRTKGKDDDKDVQVTIHTSNESERDASNQEMDTNGGGLSGGDRESGNLGGATRPADDTGSLDSEKNSLEGTSVHSSVHNASENGTGSDLDDSQRNGSENTTTQAGRLTGKQRRASSLMRGLGALRQSSPSASTGSAQSNSGNDMFHRAVNMFSIKGKDSKKRLSSAKQSASSGDLSQKSDEPDRVAESITKPAVVKGHSRSASWGAMMQVYQIKKHVPALVRQKRIEQRRSVLATNSSQVSSMSMFPSRLHELCAEPDATLSELLEALDANKEAVYKEDQAGKLPLHILGDNEGLVSTAQGKQVASAFAWKLMEANPEGITTLDNDGYMPFVKLIADWVAWVFESHRNRRKAKLAASPGIFNRGNASINNSEVVTNRDINSNVFFARRSEDTASTTRIFPKPEVWDEVEWCFSMLSLAMDELAGKSDVLFKTTRRDVFATHHPLDSEHQPKLKKPEHMRREIVCHLISKLPDLLKTVLLIETEGGETRKRILKMSVFRRMFLCKECIGDWLTQMLRKTGSASRRAVDFLELISDTEVSDYTGGFKATTVEDAGRYHEERHDVYEAVNDLEGAIGSLVSMENRQVERAAATGVIWHIMGERLARPFVLGLVLVDLILHISLMVAFRSNVQISQSAIGEISTQSVLLICCHYLIRKACEALALLTISPSIFRGYFTDVWTLFDLMAIILTMTAFLWNTKNPGTYRNGFNAFVVGLLWMKVVSFLKVVNKDMSTFILALIEILQDIKYFLVVLVVVIFMFGDMFHLAVSTKDDGEFCLSDDLEGPTQDFCNRHLTSSYLRVYSILLGDFELNDLQDTTSITTLYVIFTSIGVVILLNVLIAVIADSYEKATVSSAMLFGRARVTFVAQNEALEAFLKPGVNPLQAFRGILSNRKFISRLFTLFRWFVLLAIIATASDTAVFLVALSIGRLEAQGSRDPSFVTAALLFIMACILVSSLGVLFGFAFEGLVHRFFPAALAHIFDRMNHCNVTMVRWLAFRLFGLHSRRHHNTKTTSDDWTGRLNYMEASFERIVQDAKKELISEMSALENAAVRT